MGQGLGHWEQSCTEVFPSLAGDSSIPTSSYYRSFSQERSSKDWGLTCWADYGPLLQQKLQLLLQYNSGQHRRAPSQMTPNLDLSQTELARRGRELNSTGATQTQTWSSHGKTLKVPEVDQQPELSCVRGPWGQARSQH